VRTTCGLVERGSYSGDLRVRWRTRVGVVGEGGSVALVSQAGGDCIPDHSRGLREVRSGPPKPVRCHPRHVRQLAQPLHLPKQPVSIQIGEESLPGVTAASPAGEVSPQFSGDDQPSDTCLSLSVGDDQLPAPLLNLATGWLPRQRSSRSPFAEPPQLLQYLDRSGSIVISHTMSRNCSDSCYFAAAHRDDTPFGRPRSAILRPR
jgi:hypothetical protein